MSFIFKRRYFVLLIVSLFCTQELFSFIKSGCKNRNARQLKVNIEDLDVYSARGSKNLWAFIQSCQVAIYQSYAQNA